MYKSIVKLFITPLSICICIPYNKIDSFYTTLLTGILGDGKTTVGPERSLDKMNREWLHKTLDVNLIGHVMLTQALTPSLKKKKDDIDLSRIVNLSARVGSISDNSLGGWYSYRMTKAALNMFTKTVSIELKRYVYTYSMYIYIYVFVYSFAIFITTLLLFINYY